MIGDERKFLSILITLKVKYDSHGQPTQELDPMVQSYLFRKFAIRDISTIQEAKASQIVRDFFKEKINAVNQYAQSNVHKIKKWIILDNEFTVVRGELTPTLKIKRKVISNNY